MAADEMLLATAEVPVLRVYSWSAYETSVGVRFDLQKLPEELLQLTVVKRPTGGGIVWHGKDKTFTLMVPTRKMEQRFQVQQSYRWIHAALARCLARETGEPHGLVAEESGVLGDRCFASPVAWDVVCRGQKVAGGAQRRTRSGFLHQGSIQSRALSPSFWLSFASELAQHVTIWLPDDGQVEWVKQRAETRRTSGEWTRRSGLEKPKAK